MELFIIILQIFCPIAGLCAVIGIGRINYQTFVEEVQMNIINLAVYQHRTGINPDAWKQDINFITLICCVPLLLVCIGTFISEITRLIMFLRKTDDARSAKVLMILVSVCIV